MAIDEAPNWGEPAPWFHGVALGGNSNYAFDTVAGRHVLMLFFGAASEVWSAQAFRAVRDNRHLFDDQRACFFGITTDPTDAESGAIKQHLPGIRFFLDYDRSLSVLYGAIADDRYMPFWLVLDPQLRVLGRFAVNEA